MKVARSVAEVLNEHVTLEVECIDRLYLNLYVPILQRVQPAQVQLIFDRRITKQTPGRFRRRGRRTGDGAYDRRSTYEQIGEAGTDDVVIVVPPRRPATKSGAAEGPWAQRDRHVEMIDEVGRQAWQELVGYRQQARVEGTFLRYKRTLGCALQARGFEA